MGNENEILAVYKRNSVTEWLQKTGQAADYVNNGKSFDNYKNCGLSLTFSSHRQSILCYICLSLNKNKKFMIF